MTEETSTTDYQRAVLAFEEADRNYKEFEAKVLDGTLIEEIYRDTKPGFHREAWLGHIEHLALLKEERNTRRTEAANALRSAVQLTESQWRGPDGKSTTVTAGPFSVSSVTRRTFDAQTLLVLAQEKGVLERLLSTKAVDSKTGREYNIVSPHWDIDYDAVKNWLRDNNCEDIIEGSYDEVETTPIVKGPKLIAFLGEDK